MNEIQLLKTFKAELDRELPAHGYPGVLVARSYQPDNEGRETGPIVYMFALSSNRYGWQSRNERVNPEALEIVRDEFQWMRSSFQFTVFSPLEDPSSGDLAAVCAMLFNSRSVIDSLMSQGIGVERITEVRQPYIKNDRNQFEMTPSFDVIFTHQRKIAQASNKIEGVAVEIHPII